MTVHLFSAVIWSWFAAAESHNRLSQNQAGVIENPGLSYGLFHASVSPVYSWGVARKVEFPGVNMDIGHVRNLTWTKDSDKGKWIGYNRMRGQYMSGLEAAVPEQFFLAPTQCNLGSTSNPVAGLPDCPQGISAVKAIALAAAKGQKIYTITQSIYQSNPQVVNNNLTTHSQSVRDKVQEALDAGYEVTIHESPIMESGWAGVGYILINPQTGAGGYFIEGGGNGGVLDWWLRANDGVTSNGMKVGFAVALISLIGAAASVAISVVIMLAALSFFVAFMNTLTFEFLALDAGCPPMGRLGQALEVLAFVVSFFNGAAGVALGAWISFVSGGAIGPAIDVCKRFKG